MPRTDQFKRIERSRHALESWQALGSGEAAADTLAIISEELKILDHIRIDQPSLTSAVEALKAQWLEYALSYRRKLN